MDDECFTLDISGHKYRGELRGQSPISRSISSESLISQHDLDNDSKDKVDLDEDIVIINHQFDNSDHLIFMLRQRIYSMISSESFCKSSHITDNSCTLTICKNKLTNKLNEMSFLLRHNCGRAYPRFLRYTKVPLSKHVIQTAKRYYANIPDLTSSKNCPEPIMDYTHCLASLYLLPKEMCNGCGRRDCKKTWHNNKPCDYYPCDNCGQFKNHQCKYIHDLTTRRNQKDKELPFNVRDYLASSIKCIICGRIGHANCGINKTGNKQFNKSNQNYNKKTHYNKR